MNYKFSLLTQHSIGITHKSHRKRYYKSLEKSSVYTKYNEKEIFSFKLK